MDLLVVCIVGSSFLLIVNFDSGNSFSYFWFDNTLGVILFGENSPGLKGALVICL